MVRKIFFGTPSCGPGSVGPAHSSPKVALIRFAMVALVLVLVGRVPWPAPTEEQNSNNLTTAAPTIRGTVQAGKLLSADTSANQATDGLANHGLAGGRS